MLRDAAAMSNTVHPSFLLSCSTVRIIAQRDIPLFPQTGPLPVTDLVHASGCSTQPSMAHPLGWPLSSDTAACPALPYLQSQFWTVGAKT